jgi:hypothetical protein
MLDLPRTHQHLAVLGAAVQGAQSGPRGLKTNTDENVLPLIKS